MDYEFFGMLVALVFGWIGLIIATALLCMASNYITHMVVKAYGGWKVFGEFREWYHTHRKGPQ